MEQYNKEKCDQIFLGDFSLDMNILFTKFIGQNLSDNSQQSYVTKDISIKYRNLYNSYVMNHDHEAIFKIFSEAKRRKTLGLIF